MLLMIEGIKCAGKTTLAKMICKLGDIIFFNERKTSNYFNKIKDLDTRDTVAKHTLFFELEIAKKTNILYDRFHLTEYVFRKLEGRSMPYFETLEREICKVEHLLIFCRPNFEEAKKKIMERDFTIPPHYTQSYQMFIDIYNKSQLNKILVETF